MKKRLCGVPVDEEGYKHFKEKSFIVDHDPREIPGERTLEQVEFFANSTDYQKYYPEYAAACKQIVEQVAKEIKAYYGERDGRGGFVAMKHQNFAEYIKDLQAIHKKHTPERMQLRKEFEEAEAEWERMETLTRGDDYSRTRAKSAYYDAKEKYKNGLSELQKIVEEEVNAVEAEFISHVDDFYAASGYRLDDSVVKLLNSGIKLRDSEIERIVSDNISNTTMLRLLEDYCDKNGIDNKTVRVCGHYARCQGNDERSVFTEVVSAVTKAFGANEIESKTWGADNSYFDQLSNKVIAELDNRKVKPAVQNKEK